LKKFISMGKGKIDVIIYECEKNASNGNKSFGTGKYMQAIFLYLYSLALLDKALESLPMKYMILKKHVLPQYVTLLN
jgi:hypothetical protein